MWCCCCRSTSLDIPIKKEKRSRASKGAIAAESLELGMDSSSSDEDDDQNFRNGGDLHSVTGSSQNNGFEFPCLVPYFCCFLCCRATASKNENKGKSNREGLKKKRRMKNANQYQKSERGEFDPESYGIDPQFMVRGEAFGKQMTDQRRDEVTKNLRKVALLSSLPIPQLNAVIDEMRPTRYPPGATILRVGEVGHHCFVIEAGDVIITDIKNAPPDLVVTVGEGSFLGERALLSGDVRSATVTAKTEVSLLLLTRQAFDRTLGPLKPVIEQVTADKHATMAFYQEMIDMKKRVKRNRDKYRNARVLVDFSDPVEVSRAFQTEVEAGELNSHANSAVAGQDEGNVEVAILK